MTCEQLAEIHRACFRVPRPWSADEFAGLLAGPHCFLVPHASGFALGRAVAGEAELLTIAVLPDTRRTGLGKQLLAGFLAEAQTRQATSAFLEVAADNDAAIRLYEGQGFALAGRRKGYYATSSGAVDALIYSRALV